ncbi:DUF938 domain-containing protein [uncultured Jannaschia sp.]|uniref:DUF938 domain-containing protein n=1 Tax=uncultured Jannaschia sp. TaxID=293347 RepID=UPI002610D2FA|nr:DUF938 domain-containing protein [uncultured Jannaschia sp.]
MTAPSADRNLRPILDALLPRLPQTGHVLEIASGTGQHIAALAAHRPDVIFHPTEPDATRRASIDAHCRGLPNVMEATELDACRTGWATPGSVDAVVIVNLLHLVSDGEMSVLLDEAHRALSPGGTMAIYGPFLRNGRAISAADRAFDAGLRAQDEAVGLKDIAVLETVLRVLGFDVEVVEMPAGNVMVFGRAAAVPGL